MKISHRYNFKQNSSLFIAVLLALGLPDYAAIAQPPPFAGPAARQAQQAPNNGPLQPTNLPPGSAADLTGDVASVQTPGSALVDGSVFAQSLGTNGRSCATCHDVNVGYSVTPATVQASFTATGGTGPLFRAVDGATCPSDNLSGNAAQLSAYTLLLGKGLFRVGLPVPANTAFAISSVNDPYKCTTSVTTGLTSSTSGMVSVYRRPLPTSNLRFVSILQWDGREPNLTQQTIDAVAIHEQGTTTPTTAQINSTLAFENAHYTAQFFDNQAEQLDQNGGKGGPTILSTSATALYPTYTAWLNLTGNDSVTQAQRSIARGEQLFNTRPFQITNVAGLTPPGGAVNGNCATCHNPRGANTPTFLDIGVTGQAPPALNVAGLPVFTLVCQNTKQIFTVTDPGRALITGACADIGKTKIPELRGLASRPPYFHNGSAGSLANLVNFYDARFRIGLSAQDKADLVNYLSAL